MWLLARHQASEDTFQAGSESVETGDVNAARGEDPQDLGPSPSCIVDGHPKHRSAAQDAFDQRRLFEDPDQIRPGGSLARLELDREHRLRKPRLELRHRRVRDQASPVYDADPVADFLHVLQDVAGHENGYLAAPRRPEGET